MEQTVFVANPTRLLIAAAVGIIVLLLLIIKFKLHPVISMMIAAIIIGIGAGMPLTMISDTVEKGVGKTLQGIALLVGLGSMFGGILEVSGGAQRIAQTLIDKLGQKMDYAINVDVPDENIVHRMGGRRACVGCGATYHVVYNAPKAEDICDTCGEHLVLRDDDKPETVQKRLNVYHEQTQPLIDYYEKAGILKNVDGTVDMKDVFQAIVNILGE